MVTMSLLVVSVHGLRLEHALDHAEHRIVRAVCPRGPHCCTCLCVRRGRWQQ